MTTMGPAPNAPATDSGRHDQAGLPPQPSDWRQLSPGWWVALVLGALLVLGAIVVWLGGGADDTLETRTVSVSDVLEDGESMIGDRAVLTARIDELLTDRALAVGSDMAAAEVLVIVAPDATVRGYGLGTGVARPLPVGETYETGNVVQFTGTLRSFDRTEMADEYGLVLNEELFSEFEGDPALIVDRLDVATYGRPVLVAEESPPA